jgi:cyanophycin synthetase
MADLAQRLDVTGRRIVVLAGPGDRRNEDLVAIANAVAGRFDHYICRRDDNLRERATDEVPRIQAAALREAGVREDAISIIPDEQEAITAALNLGQPGDLLLVFADALARSWKQITKFKPAGVIVPQAPISKPLDRETIRKIAEGVPLMGEGPPTVFNLEGLIRDERGVRVAPDAED